MSSRFLILSAFIAACGSPAASTFDAPSAFDAPPPGPDAAWLPDGTPTRQQCTNSLGSALDMQHGRLDGYLVSIVPTTTRSCNGDDTHVHLQVRVNNAIYDVAVNVSDPAGVGFLAQDMALPGAPWAEGWHPGQAALLDYPSIGAHSTAFTLMSETMLSSTLDTELATANHVSIYMTGYGQDGGHNVHRRGTGQDGAIFLRPQGQTRALLFRFVDQTF
ncbi:MAG: hypothetical protein K8W52_31935 [Deltaproteobacteria bacterium]|nr:hypothetical protein [Deltaproteobacteria bacterium]